MRYVAQYENGHTIHSFQLQNGDLNRYAGELRGFTHATNTSGFVNITATASQRLMSSYWIRASQREEKKHQTGGDRGHDGQYAVYFRFVEKKYKVGLLSAILNSLGSVGSSGSAIFFLPFSQAVQKSKCFSLAGGSDGLHGVNCFDSDDVQTAEKRFRCGLEAAKSNSRTNEIGFYGMVPLDDIQVILFRSRHARIVAGFTCRGVFQKKFSNVLWSVYTNNNLPQPVLPPLQPSG